MFCVQVIAPGAADLAARQSHLASLTSPLESVASHKMVPPAVEEWRLTPTAGCLLSQTNQVVRSNHFLVKTRQIPALFFQYHLHMFAFDHNGEMKLEDVASKEDFRVTVALMSQFRAMHPEFAQVGGHRVGFVYDSRNCVVTTQDLPLPEENEQGERFVSDEVCLLNRDGSKSKKRFKLTLTYAAKVPAPADAWAKSTSMDVMRSLDLSLLAFARDQLKDDVPSWYLVGNKCFSDQAAQQQVAKAYVAMRGFTAGLKSCLAGLTLVSDMTVAVFLKGGPLVNVVWEACGASSFDSFVRDAKQYGIRKEDIATINTVLKSCKIRVDHLVRV